MSDSENKTAAVLLIEQVGEESVAVCRPDQYPTRLGFDGLCANCFGLVKANDYGLMLHASGILKCADAIRAFVEKGAEW